MDVVSVYCTYRLTYTVYCQSYFTVLNSGRKGMRSSDRLMYWSGTVVRFHSQEYEFHCREREVWRRVTVERGTRSGTVTCWDGWWGRGRERRVGLGGQTPKSRARACVYVCRLACSESRYGIDYSDTHTRTDHSRIHTSPPLPPPSPLLEPLATLACCCFYLPTFSDQTVFTHTYLTHSKVLPVTYLDKTHRLFFL